MNNHRKAAAKRLEDAKVVEKATIIACHCLMISSYLDVMEHKQLAQLQPSRLFTRREEKFRGFTIVELLIVIVVIAILASIVIVSYNGITSRATESSMKSDLHSNATALELDASKNGSYPESSSAANDGQGLKSSPDNTLTYVPKPYGYCISVVSAKTNSQFFLKSIDGVIADGGCDPIVSTIAGSGAAGFADANGASAQFSTPTDITVDSSGVVYIADTNNNRIRKISTNGDVTTLAGSGTYGFADGAGAVAQFRNPSGITVDSAGVVYVSDKFNHRIRAISPSGVVSTLAGSGVSGYADGTGAGAQFDSPLGIVVDSSGTIFVADATNRRIRKVTSAGVVTTLAGTGVLGINNGAGTVAQFNWPYDVDVDSEGNVYVADTFNDRIRKITPSGVVSTFAGTTQGYVDDTGVAAQFNDPRGIAIDKNGDIYVADELNRRIRKITPAGVVTTLAGTGVQGFADGSGANAQFNSARGVAVDSAGTVYIVDMTSQRIRKIAQ